MPDLPLILSSEKGAAAALIRLASLVLGLAIVIRTFIWAAQVMMIQGAEPGPLARFIFRACRVVFQVTGRIVRNPRRRRRFWALYMPVSLLSILFVAVVLGTIGFIFVIYAISGLDLRDSVLGSVSSMSTLGFANQPADTSTAVVYAIEGLTLTFFIGVIIVYVNVIFDDYNKRRAKMRTLDAKIDHAKTGFQLIENAASSHDLDMLTPIFGDWVADFIQLRKNHRSLEGYLSLYALDSETYWLVDVPVILEAANVRNTLVALPPDPQATRCLKHFAETTERVVDYFKDKKLGAREDHPQAGMTRAVFDQGADRLAQRGVPVVADRESSWLTFDQTRAGYELLLAELFNVLDLSFADWIEDYD